MNYFQNEGPRARFYRALSGFHSALFSSRLEGKNEVLLGAKPKRKDSSSYGRNGTNSEFWQ
jgi:hypothetical protein